MKVEKCLKVKFHPNVKDNLPYQCNGFALIKDGPIGFYKNINTDFKGVVFKDNIGNVTYFDVTYNIVQSFNENVWGYDNFVYQPQMNCLKIVSDS